MNPLIPKMLSGNRAALARLMTQVENRVEGVSETLAALESRTGKAHRIGITGPPGAGKSTLADQLITQYRKQNKTVGVIAVDPSSPFTGGALLGDRIRMMDHAQDPGVFIRSLGSRGAHGGLSRATRDLVRLLDAFGMDVILIETVGVGQTELDVLDVVHTTLVVLTPESGDTIQTLKAGLLEAADIFVVNKADREGAHKIHQELFTMIEMATSRDASEWHIPVLQVQAHLGKGIEELVETMRAHFQHLSTCSLYPSKQSQVRLEEFWEMTEEYLRDLLMEALATEPDLKKIQEDVGQGKKNPFEAALEIRKRMSLIVHKI